MKSYRVIAYRDAFGLVWEQSNIPTVWASHGIAETFTHDRLRQERPLLRPIEVDDQEALLAENALLRRERDEARAQKAALEVEIEPLRLLRRPPSDSANDVTQVSYEPAGGRRG